MYQVVPTVILASAALLAVTPTIVGQIAKDVARGTQGLRTLLSLSLWAGVVTLMLVVASVVSTEVQESPSPIWPALAVFAFLIQAVLFTVATTRFWTSKFRLY
jgi:ABC-type transport system involved in Fe-S cluster assembly fused permease/ATPase subunit